MRVLHAIHDFLPAHRAGSEIYAYHLAKEQAKRHDVGILCAELDPARPQGALMRREFDGLPVLELVNNWRFSSLEETYGSPAIDAALDAALEQTTPDVLHVHSLLNLSFALPALARARGIRCVATLHDYTLFCPSGGQRVHVAERHVCHEIEPERCARCFQESPFYRQMRLAGASSVPGPPALRHFVDRLLGRRGDVAAPTADAIARRLEAVARVASAIDVFVSPSRSVASESARLGIPEGKIRVSDYGFTPLAPRERTRSAKLRVGFVGTLVWHKGAHVLVEAVSRLPKEGVELLVFGNLDWFPRYVERLRRLAHGSPVRFMGPFGTGGAADVLRELDVLVVPSLWPENSPLVIHEAHQAGLPVVGADVGGIPELVRHEVSGLLYEAASPEALAAALGRLLDEPQLLAQFARALPAVKTIEEDAAEWDAVYRDVLSRPAAA